MTATARDGWATDARRLLSDAGHRRGGARDAVIDCLADEPCALTAQEIEERLRADGQAVGRASVYRALDVLVEHGLATKLEVKQGIARFEAATRHDHHHHLLCETCGELVPFDDPDLEASIDALADRLGFTVAEHDVVLHGECAACGARARGRAAAPTSA